MALKPGELEAAAAAKVTPVNLAGMSAEEIAALRGDDGTPAAGTDENGNLIDEAAGEEKGAADEGGKAGAAGGAAGEGAAAAGAAGGKGGEGEPRVPQSRVNEIVARSRQRLELAQNRIVELEKAVAKGEEDLSFEEVEKEIDKLELGYSELLLKGKAEEASALRRNIRVIERRLANTQAAYHAENRSTAAVEELRVDAVIDELEAGYAFLDPNDPTYDKDIVDEILAYQRGFVATGHRGDIAMSMAADYVLSQLDLVPEGSEEEQEGAGEGESEGEGKAADAGKGEGLRRTVDTAGKALLAARLPPSMRGGKPGMPQSTTAKDLVALGQEGFNKIRGKMSEEDLAKARGDTV